MSVTAADIERAVSGLGLAAEVLRRHAGGPIHVEMKDGWSPVTAADREVDVLLRSLLPGPGDGWLSEESEDDGQRVHCRRVWVVDPLDGTRAFVARRPDYSVSIALLIDGEPRLGAIGHPATGVTVVGGPGLGVQVHGTPGLPWPVLDERLRVMVSRSEWKGGEWAHLDGHCQLLPCGSVAWELALVAAGVADATWTLHPKHEWDVAAGAALVAAAGGELWLPRGGHLRWNRSRPRFLSFAAAGAGHRAAAETLLRLGR